MDAFSFKSAYALLGQASIVGAKMAGEQGMYLVQGGMLRPAVVALILGPA